MDLGILFGLLIGIGGIFIGNLLEGGHTSSLVQLTALIIVICGTLGATLISNSLETFKLGFHLLIQTITGSSDSSSKLSDSIAEIIDCTKTIKRESFAALDNKVGKIKDPFLRRILRNVADGIDPIVTRETFEAEIDSLEEFNLAAAKVWTDAGGYSPTIGILGAVLGLIHVMGNLTDTSKLGSGIAVAFVATVYGVGFANLIFLPFGTKIKKMVEKNSHRKRVLLEGALLVNSGLSSTIVEQRLKAYIAGDSLS